jgi:uncharacterized protein YndB with AHSA1/START domain
MARIIGEIVIDRPVEEVFDFAADGCNEPKYNPETVQSVKVTTGPIGTGTRFALTHLTAGRSVSMSVEVTEYERPHRLAMHTAMSWADVQEVLTFDPAGTGTRMRWAWNVRPKGMAISLAPIVSVIGARQERALWEGLKRYLETAAAQAKAAAATAGTPATGPR